MANDDGNWKPSGRPTSLIAKDFSDDLNNAFATDNSLSGLVQSVQQKKEAVNSQTQELHALEAQLRDTEKRLKERQLGNPSSADKVDSTNSPNRRDTPGNTFGDQEKNRPEPSTTDPLARQAPASQPLAASTVSYWKST